MSVAGSRAQSALSDPPEQPPDTVQPWDLEDLVAWDALNKPRTALNALFLDAVRRSLTICIPPDCAFDSGANVLDTDFMKLHILIPDPVLTGSFTPLGRDKSEETKLDFLRRKLFTPRTTPRSGVGIVSRHSPAPSSLESAGDDSMSDRVDRLEAAPHPMLVAAGPSWGDAPVRARVLWEEDIRTSDGSAHIMVLDRALTAAAGSDLSSPLPKVAVFGDSRRDNVMSATDVLFELDSTGELMRCINTELQSFREHYEPVDGREDDLFARVDAISKTQSKRWIGNLGKNFLSKRKSVRATALAVNTYVHGRLYQFVFPAMCQLYAMETAEFESGAERIQCSGKVLADFEVPVALASQLDLSRMKSCFDRLNVSTSPFDKVQACCDAIDTLTRLVNDCAHTIEGMSADILVPALAVSLAHYPPRDMPAQIAYMDRFLPREACMGAGEERSYTVVSFHAAVEFIRRYSDEEIVQRRMSQITVAKRSASTSAEPSHHLQYDTQ